VARGPNPPLISSISAIITTISQFIFLKYETYLTKLENRTFRLHKLLKAKRIKVLLGSKNVMQMVMVMVYARLLVVTNLNRLVSNFSVVSDYGWTKTNII
jgi:hypothetical protein